MHCNNTKYAISQLQTAKTKEPGNPEIIKIAAIIYYLSGNISGCIEELSLLQKMQAAEPEILKIEEWKTLALKRKWPIHL
jgi:hypothetical protein